MLRTILFFHFLLVFPSFGLHQASKEMPPLKAPVCKLDPSEDAEAVEIGRLTLIFWEIAQKFVAQIPKPGINLERELDDMKYYAPHVNLGEKLSDELKKMESLSAWIGTNEMKSLEADFKKMMDLYKETLPTLKLPLSYFVQRVRINRNPTIPEIVHGVVKFEETALYQKWGKPVGDLLKDSGNAHYKKMLALSAAHTEANKAWHERDTVENEIKAEIAEQKWTEQARIKNLFGLHENNWTEVISDALNDKSKNEIWKHISDSEQKALRDFLKSNKEAVGTYEKYHLAETLYQNLSDRLLRHAKDLDSAQKQRDLLKMENWEQVIKYLNLNPTAHLGFAIGVERQKDRSWKVRSILPVEGTPLVDGYGVRFQVFEDSAEISASEQRAAIEKAFASVFEKPKVVSKEDLKLYCTKP